MAVQGWSSLPAELVDRVADCLLATNDLDCYTDLRAVCRHWRSVTADPRSNQHDPRFCPSRWVMLDDHKAAAFAIGVDSALLFVNTATGRFLRRSLPLLHDGDRGGYVFVTSTPDGLLVLAAREPPHAVSALNPFTGSLVRFAAPLPSYTGPQLTADVVGSWPTTLVLFSVTRSFVYWAEPQNESFSAEKNQDECPGSMLPLIAAAGKLNRGGSVAYFQLADRDVDERHIYKFSIGRTYFRREQEPELVSAAAMGNMCLWTLTEVLCRYTMDVPALAPGHPVMRERCSSLELHSEDYIDYAGDSDEDYGYHQHEPYYDDDDDGWRNPFGLNYE